MDDPSEWVTAPRCSGPPDTFLTIPMPTKTHRGRAYLSPPPSEYTYRVVAPGDSTFEDVDRRKIAYSSSNVPVSFSTRPKARLLHRPTDFRLRYISYPYPLTD